MSVGRTLGLQASWDEVMRAMTPEGADQQTVRNAIDAADSMNRQIEEFINRYTVRSTTDGDTITLESAGTYVFDGSVELNGTLTMAGTTIRTSASGQRVEIRNSYSGGVGSSLPSILFWPSVNADNASQMTAVEAGSVYYTYIFAPYDDSGSQTSPGYLRLSSDGTVVLGTTTGFTNQFIINTSTSFLGGTGFVEINSSRVPTRTPTELNAGTGGTFYRLYITSGGRLVRTSTAGA